MDFGKRLVRARERLGFSQSGFAKELGMQPQALLRYEKGKTKPSIELLRKLTDMFKINANWLLTGQGSMFLDDSGHSAPPKDDKEFELICDYLKELDRNKRKKVLKLILELGEK